MSMGSGTFTKVELFAYGPSVMLHNRIPVGQIRAVQWDAAEINVAKADYAAWPLRCGYLPFESLSIAREIFIILLLRSSFNDELLPMRPARRKLVHDLFSVGAYLFFETH
jgi:hypothetical protein